MKFSRFSRNLVAAASLLGMSLFAGGESAEAATETANLTVDATVSAACIITTTPVNFGVYDALGAQATTDLDNSGGSVELECANGLPLAVRLSEGANPDAGSVPGAPLRRMAGPAAGDFLSYQLYSDAPGGTVWGDDAASDVDGITGLGAGNLVTLTVFGRVPAGQSPNAGAYSDTVVASVDF